MKAATQQKPPVSCSRFLADYQPRVQIEIKKFPYTLKTATTWMELEQAFSLRGQVFAEQSGNENFAQGDYDAYDPTCDHIVIYDDRSREMVGTYRVRSTKFNTNFYSESEFDLSPILALRGGKMELGRAAVHRDYRNGSTIALLWRAIAKYAIRSESKLLFGCSSVFTTDFLTAARVYVHLRKKGHESTEARTLPVAKYRVQNLESFVRFIESRPNAYSADENQELIPTLFQAYLKMGAKICGEPALDSEFNCVDFLTLLDLERLNHLFRRFQD